MKNSTYVLLMLQYSELHCKAQFVQQTSSGLIESDAHIARRKW
tara:strand:+ start:1189 stop:1317 length:129 start_codon:yes stop_codon:yes gene_type:complete